MVWMKVFSRSVLAAMVLVVGAWVSYSFGAGYFQKLSLPTPWNIVGTAALGLSFVFWSALIVLSGRRSD